MKPTSSILAEPWEEEDIPVFEEFDGYSRFAWFKNGKLHRDSGPAIICHGYQAWCKNGEYHRDSGPAVIYSDGTQEWWIDGVRQK